jgi:hypothetical protein
LSIETACWGVNRFSLRFEKRRLLANEGRRPRACEPRATRRH